MFRVLAFVLAVGCAASTRPTPGTAIAAPKQPAWLEPGRLDAVVHSTLGGVRLEGIAVVDLEGGRVFVTGASHRLEALDLRSGTIVFRSNELVTPIAVFTDSAVVALGQDGRLLLLDRDDGHRLFVSDPVSVPGVGSITGLEYKDGRLEIDWLTVESQNLACCGGGDTTTTWGDTRIDLSTGVSAHRSQQSRQHRPVPLRQNPVLPPEIMVSFSIGPVDRSEMAARFIEVTIAGSPAWRHPVAPLHLPEMHSDPRPSTRS
jgi:hypothetical protein